MTNDPIVLSSKIAKYIDSQPEAVTYEQIEERALSKGIDIGLLENALSLLHKRKRVDVTPKDGTILYKKKKVAAPKPPGSHLKWLRDNYPRMEPFIMPFPEIDMSWIVLRPEEMKQFKADAKGIPLHMMKIHGRK